MGGGGGGPVETSPVCWTVGVVGVAFCCDEFVMGRKNVVGAGLKDVSAVDGRAALC